MALNFGTARFEKHVRAELEAAKGLVDKLTKELASLEKKEEKKPEGKKKEGDK